MLFELDNIVLSDSCEVIEIVASQHYVYPIFKNGSTSLRETQRVTKWRSIYNIDIESIQTPITVYLRNPRERFISGVNTFVQHCLRDYPELDTKTILHFVKHHLFLNQHYSPQFYWLINLARYSSVPLVFEHLDSINQIVAVNDRTLMVPPSDSFLNSIKDFSWSQLELYFFLDQLLLDKIGQPITFAQLITDIKNTHPDFYQLIFQKNIKFSNVLFKA
jgi:hypothetical protein